MELKFNYKSSYKLQKDYIKFHLFKHQRIHLNNLIVSFFLILFFIYSLIKNEKVMAISSVIIIIFVNLLLLIVIYKIYRDALYKRRFDEDTLLEITLKDDKFEVLSLEHNDRIAVEFIKIFKIYDLKNYIYIYLNKTQAVCIEKDKLISGDISKYFEDFKKSNFATKYKKY